MSKIYSLYCLSFQSGSYNHKHYYSIKGVIVFSFTRALEELSSGASVEELHLAHSAALPFFEGEIVKHFGEKGWKLLAGSLKPGQLDLLDGRVLTTEALVVNGNLSNARLIAKFDTTTGKVSKVYPVTRAFTGSACYSHPITWQELASVLDEAAQKVER